MGQWSLQYLNRDCMPTPSNSGNIEGTSLQTPSNGGNFEGNSLDYRHLATVEILRALLTVKIYTYIAILVYVTAGYV